ncbi:MAG: protein-disulfide reductase DsbD family protein [Verrucomicrobia bacterium]|nr:protein-disulfide reductase DsbD family protein [Verrucomicrobiota bacterium]
MTRLPTFLLAIAAIAAPARAQFATPFGAANATSTTATLISEAQTIAPGKPFTLALQLKHPAGWHSYYLNSGGVENSPAIEWKLPAGFSAGPIQWPVPTAKDGFFGKSFVYAGSPALLVDITAPATLQAGETVTLSAKATWQICAESCINEGQEFTLSLPVAASAVADPAQAAFFSQARSRIPTANPAWTLRAYPAAGNFVLRLSPPAGTTVAQAQALDFIPNERFLKSLSDGGKVSRDGSDWIVTLQRNAVDFNNQAIPVGKTLSGILLGGKPGAPDAYAMRIPEVKIGPPPAVPLSLLQLLPILGGMLLGGLILNLMPCVFPVIGLKIMGFVQQAGDERGKIMGHGLLFALGVLVSFGVLSGILFAGRAAADIGWGYQLQFPGVVLGLMLLMFVLALNLFGLFEIGTAATSVGGKLQSQQGLAGSFCSGVLATIVATPCSAPFLGAAIGAAIGLPAVQFFAAFAAMAIGLALPYLILSAFPHLLRLLPRPGPWMVSFKQAMSFLLFATAGYLLWVYGGQIGLEYMLGPVFGLCLIAMAGWIYGRWFLPHLSRATRRTALTLALAFAAGGLLLAMPPKAGLKWEPWSPTRVDQLLEQGRPVYIDFTAQWCLTCQLNKKLAYSPAVIALMKAKNIAALKADKTNPSPEIEAKLQELGRTAIPVNVLLVPGKAAIVAPELLSAAYLTDLFTKEVPAAGTAEK